MPKQSHFALGVFYFASRWPGLITTAFSGGSFHGPNECNRPSPAQEAISVSYYYYYALSTKSWISVVLCTACCTCIHHSVHTRLQSDGSNCPYLDGDWAQNMSASPVGATWKSRRPTSAREDKTRHLFILELVV